jgi:thiol-disulfide isomerase/thioredoxin
MRLVRSVLVAMVVALVVSLVGCNDGGPAEGFVPAQAKKVVAEPTGTTSVEKDGAKPPAAPVATHPDPGPLDAVMAAAKAEGKALFVEFYTTWCEPCKIFDAKIIPEPAVQAALGKVKFVRYDAERGNGIDVAKKYKINSYPSFLAVDEKGEAQLERTGIDVSASKWFLDFLAEGALAVQSEESVLAARAKAPTDAKLALSAGRWYVRHDRPDDALPHFAAAVAADKGNAAGIAEDAAWEQATLRRRTAIRAMVTKDLAAYVDAFPGGTRAELALALASSSGVLPPSQRRALWTKLVDAHRDDASALNGIIYAAIAAGELDAALAAGKRQVELSAEDPNAYDSLAEAHNYRKERELAVATADKGIAIAKADTTGGQELAPALEENRARFAATEFMSEPGIEGTKRRMAAHWTKIAAVENVGEERDASVDEAMAAMQAARAKERAVLDDAGGKCIPHAGTLTEAYVRLDFSAGAQPKVTVLEPDAPAALATCLVDELSKAPFQREADAPKRVVSRIGLAPEASAGH